MKDAQKEAASRQDAEALEELERAQQVVRGLGPGGDLCVSFSPLMMTCEQMIWQCRWSLDQQDLH